MKKNFEQLLSDFFKKIGDFFLKTGLGRIVGLSTIIIGFLQTVGVWEILIDVVVGYLDFFSKFLLFQFFEIPVYFWVLSLILLAWLLSRDKYLKLVSGEFFDDFSQGLSSWEYGGEGWKIEFDDKIPVLSVSESQDGGISKKGFSWSDYEFSFETKVIKHNSGWIFRAENRSKYLMLQLHLEEIDRPLLRLHIKIPSGTDYPWVVIQEDPVNLSKNLSILEWIKVKIIVSGSNVDVFLNDEHAGHYFIADPLRIPSEETVIIKEKDKKSAVAMERTISIVRRFISMNYAIGRVGFRCAPPNEHAHFRKVRVKPLF